MERLRVQLSFDEYGEFVGLAWTWFDHQHDVTGTHVEPCGPFDAWQQRTDELLEQLASRRQLRLF